MTESSEKYDNQSRKQGSHRRVVITEEIRQAMHDKRLSLGLSYSGAAQYIGVHWSTFRKWENGETSLFTREMERRIRHFLESPKPVYESGEHEEDSNRMLDKLIHRLRNIHRLCHQTPGLQEKLMLRMEVLLDEILNNYSQTL